MFRLPERVFVACYVQTVLGITTDGMSEEGDVLKKQIPLKFLLPFAVAYCSFFMRERSKSF